KLSTFTRSVVRVTRSWTNTSAAGLAYPYMSLAQLVSPATRLGEAEQKATKRPSALTAGAPLPQLPWVPALSTLTRSVMPVCRSWTKTSAYPLVASATRLVAYDSKATKRPSALIEGLPLEPLPSVPALLTLTRSVVPVHRSRTNTSCHPLVSPGTRWVAREEKATKRPSALIAGLLRVSPPLFASFPALSTFTRSVVPVRRSWTNTSTTPLVSPGTRLVAPEMKTTNRPLALSDG